MIEKYAVLSAIRTITDFPGKEFSVRGLAAASRLSPQAAKIALDYMLEKGMVLRRVIGRSHLYKADFESALCRQWKILFNLERLQNWGVVEKIANRVKGIHSVLLYGSYGRGTNDEKSDIDLLVIAHAHDEFDYKIFRAVNKEFNMTIMTMQEWQRKAGEERVFYENVIYDSIVLQGTRPVVL